MSRRSPRKSRKRKHDEMHNDDEIQNASYQQQQPPNKKRRCSNSRSRSRHTAQRRKPDDYVDKNDELKEESHSLEINHNDSDHDDIDIDTSMNNKKHTKHPRKSNKSNKKKKRRNTMHGPIDIDDNDDNDDEVDMSSESNDTSDHHIPTRINQSKSQPSTPVRGINSYSKHSPPLSQSAKRSHRKNNTSPFSHIIFKTIQSKRTEPIPIDESPQFDDDTYDDHDGYERNEDDRKVLPNWHNSQDSISPSPELSSPPSKSHKYDHPYTNTTYDIYTNTNNNGYNADISTNITATTDGSRSQNIATPNINQIPFGVPPPQIPSNNQTEINHNINHHNHDYNHQYNVNNDNNLDPFPLNNHRHSSPITFNNISNYHHNHVVHMNFVQSFINDLMESKIFKGDGLLFMISYILIGFFVGCIVVVSVYQQDKVQSPIETLPVTTTTQCACNQSENSTFPLCQPLFTDFANLDDKCKQCDVEHKQWKKKLNEIELQKECKNCYLKSNLYEEEKKQCLIEKDQLLAEKERLQKKKIVTIKDCNYYLQEIKQLEHDLGECNVEWGSCKQEGRMKDALDKKRLDDIKKHENRYNMCNDQLKKLKLKAKKAKQEKKHR